MSCMYIVGIFGSLHCSRPVQNNFHLCFDFVGGIWTSWSPPFYDDVSFSSGKKGSPDCVAQGEIDQDSPAPMGPGELNSGDVRDCDFFCPRDRINKTRGGACAPIWRSIRRSIAKNAAPGASDGAQAIWRARYGAKALPHRSAGAPARYLSAIAQRVFC
jgi:hypothetical protein